jgi:hypothetical protein
MYLLATVQNIGFPVNDANPVKNLILKARVTLIFHNQSIAFCKKLIEKAQFNNLKIRNKRI